MTQIREVVDDGRRKPRTRTLNELPSETVQAEKDQADIRKIIQTYERNGVLINPSRVDLTFRDVTEFSDFADLMLQSKAAETEFMRLPSKVREVFDHSVAKWLDAAHDPEKLAALRPRLETLGVLEPIPEPPREPSAAPVEPPPTPSTPPTV